MLRACLDDHILHAPFVAMASRDGLLLLRRLGDHVKVWLRACDVLTGAGHVTSLPPTTLPHAYCHVVLSVGGGGAGRFFELLVADMNERFLYQTFSSKDSRWSDIRQAKRRLPHPTRRCSKVIGLTSAVIGRTVYWPCRVDDKSHCWDQILALDADSGEATVIQLPPGCCYSRVCLPLSRVRGRLCVLTEESHEIAMWTLTCSMAGKWSRQVVVSKLEIARQAGRLGAANLSPIFVFKGFGEKSGVVILFNGGFILRLDLVGIKEETPVVTLLGRTGTLVPVKEVLVHEIDVISLLQAMKYF